MRPPELADSSAHRDTRTHPTQRHVVVGTWTMSRREPNLF